MLYELLIFVPIRYPKLGYTVCILTKCPIFVEMEDKEESGVATCAVF